MAEGNLKSVSTGLNTLYFSKFQEDENRSGKRGYEAERGGEEERSKGK